MKPRISTVERHERIWLPQRRPRSPACAHGDKGAPARPLARMPHGRHEIFRTEVVELPQTGP